MKNLCTKREKSWRVIPVMMSNFEGIVTTTQEGKDVALRPHWLHDLGSTRSKVTFFDEKLRDRYLLGGFK